jgi:hypothetical protein
MNAASTTARRRRQPVATQPQAGSRYPWSGHAITQPSEPVVICSGGELDERSFVLSAWDAEIRAAEHLLNLGQKPAPVLGYQVDKTDTTVHRSGLVGMPATWIGLDHLRVKGGGCR